MAKQLRQKAKSTQATKQKQPLRKEQQQQQ